MPPTDEQLQHASPAERAYWMRVYLLVQQTNCPIELAIAAVEQADKESTR